MNLLVENPNLEDLAIGDVPGRRETGVIISRIKRAGESDVRTATEQTVLRRGDAILAVGPRKSLEQFRVIVGRESDVNLTQTPGQVATRRIVVTRKDVLGHTIGELALDARFGVIVTRITRADLEMTALPELRLQFGDMLQIVGAEEALPKAAKELGNSPRALNETNFTPIFIGIALGVLAGMLPIAIPAMPVPVKLGLAGGPLVWPSFWPHWAHRTDGVVYASQCKHGVPRTGHCVVPCVRWLEAEKIFSTVFTSRPGLVGRGAPSP
jgi:putative transport protein